MKHNYEFNIKYKVIAFLVVFTLISSFVSSTIYNFFYSQQQEQYSMGNGVKKVYERESFFQSFIQHKRDLLESLRQNKRVQSLPDRAKEESLEDLEELFFLLARSEKSLMQVRYIDETGQERVRLNRTKVGQLPFLIPQEKLQNKSQRDYFIDAKNNEDSKIHYSSFDLNIEDGKIQTPFMPTFRTYFRLKGKNGFAGIIIMNFFAESFFDKLFYAPLYDMILLDSKGFTLNHYLKNRSWSKFSDDSYNISSEFPEHFQNILSEPLVRSDKFISKRLDLPIEQELILVLKLNHSFLIESSKLKHEQQIKIITYTSLIILLVTFVIFLAFRKVFTFLNIEKELNNSLEKLVENRTQELLELNQKISIQNEQVLEQRDLLQKANEEFETLFLSAPTPYMLIDKEFSIVRCNLLAKKLFEFAQTPQQDIRKHIYQEDIDTFLNIFEDSNQINTKLSIQLQTNDNKYEHFKVFIVQNPTDSNLLFLSFVNVENDLLLAQQSKLAALGEMMDAIAHQWKQPLSVIMSHISHLTINRELGNPLDELLPNLEKSIKEQTKHLIETIDQFRLFFRNNADSEEVEILDEIHYVLELSKSVLIKNNVEVNFTKTQDVKYHLFPAEFRHVILNLINNSIDAFNEKEILSRELYFEIFQGKNKVYITVEDNAKGIDEQIIDSIFQAHTSTKFENGGTGIGLYMTKQIIEKLRGKISVQNTQEGAKFTIELPL